MENHPGWRKWGGLPALSLWTSGPQVGTALEVGGHHRMVSQGTEDLRGGYGRLGSTATMETTVAGRGEIKAGGELRQISSGEGQLHHLTSSTESHGFLRKSREGSREGGEEG